MSGKINIDEPVSSLAGLGLGLSHASPSVDKDLSGAGVIWVRERRRKGTHNASISVECS